VKTLKIQKFKLTLGKFNTILVPTGTSDLNMWEVLGQIEGGKG